VICFASSARDDVNAIDDLREESRVVVGCSGGADSLALLVLARLRGFDVIAVYVDHRLRAGTELEARIVRDAAARFGARARLEPVAVDHTSNLEARARDARYAALERVRVEENADAILVGHTRDDQAETVLLNLLRGSGTAGLAGIPARRGHVRRPLLGLRRAQTAECCARLGLAPVHDPMNDELRHRRVWLRREVIPALERGARRDLVEVLARQAEVLRADETLLDDLAAGHAIDDAAAIAALPEALARRVVRRFLGSPPASFAVVERVLAVAHGEHVATELPGGDRVQRVAGRLVRVRSQSTAPPEPVTLQLPGRAQLGPVAIEAWIEHAPPVAWPDGRWLVVCDADLVPDTVAVQPGAALPVLTAASGRPVWPVGYRVSDKVRVSARTRRYLWLSAEPAS
jgi:tRNA(Ile)-lysidine synthase